MVKTHSKNYYEICPKKSNYSYVCINRSTYNISRYIGAYQYNQTIHLKKLETIWNNLPKRFNIDEKNTLLIDDNYDNCVYNRSNSLPARKFVILKET